MSVLEIILLVAVIIEFLLIGLLIWHVITIKIDLINLVDAINFKDMTDGPPEAKVVIGTHEELKQGLKDFIGQD